MIDLTRRAALAGLAAVPAAAALGASPAWAQEAGPARGVFTLGDPNAPVHVIEYASLTCPHCARFHAEVYPRLKSDYIDSGKARLEMREVYFDPQGLWAALLARCGGEARYFPFISVLLERQRAWARNEPQDVAQELARIGRQGGLTDDEINACLTDQTAQRDLVEMYQGYRDDPLLTGTPTLVVEGRKVENPTFDRLSSAIDAALGG
ncbi:MAG: DsbA family protein [Pseudomonadota bacterium]